MKCKNITINGVNSVIPHPNSTKLDTPYFRIYLTVHTISLNEMLHTSIIFYDIEFYSKEGKSEYMSTK